MMRESKNKFGLAGNIVSFFTMIILLIFPLFVHDQYWDILVAKYMFFYIVVIAMTVLVIGVQVIKIRKREGLNGKDIFKALKGPDIGVLFFWIIALISTCVSPYFYEAFWGNEGRYCGFFFLTLCTVLYFIVSRRLKFSRWFVDAFLIGALLVCLWGISDFFQLDIFGFKVQVTPGDKPNFTSSFGNINTYTAYVSFVIGVAGTMFIGAPRNRRLMWYALCTAVSLLAIIVGWSDNAYLALAALFGFLPFYAFRTREGAKRYLVLLVLFASVIQSVVWVCEAFKGRVVEASSLFDVLSKLPWLPLIVLLGWGIVLIIYYLDRKKDESSWNKISPYFYRVWGLFIIVVIAAIIILLIAANTAEDPHKYGFLSKYLVFNDEWGTHRLFNWKLGIANYKEFPLINKIFGYGPETYGIVTVNNNYTEMVQMFNEKYDNAHNEYLQYFITMGPFGLAAYLGMLISGSYQIIKKMVNTPEVMALFFAVFCYAIQATVNIAVPMTTPFVWLFLAMGVAAYRNRDIKEGSVITVVREQDEE